MVFSGFMFGAVHAMLWLCGSIGIHEKWRSWRHRFGSIAIITLQEKVYCIHVVLNHVPVPRYLKE